MKLFLVDLNPDLVGAWDKIFNGAREVTALCGDILALAENTIVSPANSYGFMDGGIDMAYTDHFGLRPQTEIQKQIALREEGYLPVGAAVFVETGNPRVPYMISAPTMETPGAVSAANAFFAMSAVLQAAARHRDVVTSVYCPGLATGIGQVSPKRAAEEMAKAYFKWRSINQSGGY